jgi:hypothetical protein
VKIKVMALTFVYRTISTFVFSSLVGLASNLQAQDHGFEFGRILNAELNMKIYEKDTTAVAVVLDEFGEAFFDLETLNKINFQYHVKIKILKEQGKSYADFEIPMRKSGSARQETVRNIKASSFNRNGNTWTETILQSKSIFTENANEYYSLTKFAVPDVRVGSVIEVYYELESPFTYNFMPWEFQWDIPKVKSEFWAKYPAYYEYAITLKGFLNLTKNVGERVDQCVGSGTIGYSAGPSADCSLFKFGIENIPAFKEEEFMTARKNFVSTVTFELSKITHQNGRVDKITTEWKDAELELKQHENFGVQIKKARNLFEDKVKELKASSSDQLTLAKQIHSYFKETYTWNGGFGEYTENGIKKAAELKKGNVGDLNLSLLGALQEAGIYAEPVLISTRANGLPIQHHPVLTDFNYVLVRVKIADKFYFVDATSSLYPFGYIPERCLNGQGRALGETSAWIDIKPIDKDRIVSDFKIKLSEDGITSGSCTINSNGYAAVNRRRMYVGSDDKEDYIKKRTENWSGVQVNNFSIENESDLMKAFIEKFDVTLEESSGGSDIIYFPLFLFQRNDKNPFTSRERLYPVDFGAPIEYVYLMTFEFPSNYNVEDIPKNLALSLPNAGGRFLFSVSQFSGKITVTSSLILTKSVYSAEEYHALREIYSRYIEALQSLIVLKKK